MEEKVVIELTEEQVGNLMVFLSRASMQGNEVPAYVELMNAVNSAKAKGLTKESKKEK